MRHPCQACDNHAQGHPAGSPHPWRACLRSHPPSQAHPKNVGPFQGQRYFPEENYHRQLLFMNTESKTLHTHTTRYKTTTHSLTPASSAPAPDSKITRRSHKTRIQTSTLNQHQRTYIFQRNHTRSTLKAKQKGGLPANFYSLPVNSSSSSHTPCLSI